MREWIQGLFNSEARERRAFEKLAMKLVSKNQQHEDRMLALESLSEIDTPEAIAALFRRWDLTADKEREDRAEKEYLQKILVSKGPRMIDALRAHNDRSLNVTLPVQVLKQVQGAEDVTSEILRVLENEGKRLASFRPEKKVTLLRLLREQDDARIADATEPFLNDFDESVRCEAAQLLGHKGTDASRDALIARLTHEDEDSARVKGAILGAFAAMGWNMKSVAKQIKANLGQDWVLGSDGKVAAKP